MKLAGGCLCQTVRYAIDATLIDAGFCHCTLCQKSSGAPTVAWLTIPFSGFHYTQGNAAIYGSSQQAQREYCASCGTQIAFRKKEKPDTIDVTLCSLDDNTAIKPEYHIWVQSKVDWLTINDGLPQYLDQGPDSF